MADHANITRRALLGAAAIAAGCGVNAATMPEADTIAGYRRAYAAMSEAWVLVQAERAGPFSEGTVWSDYWAARQEFEKAEAGLHALLHQS